MPAIKQVDVIHVSLPTRREHKWTGLTELCQTSPFMLTPCGQRDMNNINLFNSGHLNILLTKIMVESGQ